MSVTVNETPNGDYTLDELNVAWNSGDDRLEKQFNEAHRILFDVSVNETLGVSDVYQDYINYILNIVESFGVSDSAEKTSSLELVDSFGVTSNEAWTFTQEIAESFSIGDSSTQACDYVRAFNEVFGVSDALAKSGELELAESLSVAEATDKLIGKNLMESLGFAGNFARTAAFLRTYSETLNLDEVCGKDVTLLIEEVFGVADQHAQFDFTKNVLRNLNIAEAMGRIASFTLNVQEGLTIAEAVEKVVTLPIEESFGIIDQYLRNADSVVSDIIIGTGDITEDTFVQYLKRQSPVEYRDFREFIEGEYKYEDAVFKIMLDSMGAERALLDKLNIVVDLPDVRDSGRATLTTTPAGLDITFNRTFHATPEVIAQLRGGTVIATPYITASDENGFTVVLKDSSGTVVAGDISWYAEGY